VHNPDVRASNTVAALAPRTPEAAAQAASQTAAVVAAARLKLRHQRYIIKTKTAIERHKQKTDEFPPIQYLMVLKVLLALTRSFRLAVSFF
jgi:hypothetical protein